jgi:hypothetical protein
MAQIQVTTQDSNLQRKSPKNRSRWYRRWWFITAVPLVIAAIALGMVKIVTAEPAASEPPETAKVLAAQESMGNFAIIIPGYLPKGFDRANVEIQVNRSGSGGQPAVDMVYRGKNNASIFLHQWVPINPALETLNGSRIIQTNWGKSWLLTEGTDGLDALWVDVGPLRVALSSSQDVVSREQLVESANTLGVASQLQSFSYVTQMPEIKDMAPPPPFVVPVNAEGIQELNLTITPGGYSPLRFSVKKGVPVKINFRQMGDVGCGNSLVIPTENGNLAGLTLSKTVTSQNVTFTPDVVGNIGFHCSSNHFRGVMTVLEASQP